MKTVNHQVAPRPLPPAEVAEMQEIANAVLARRRFQSAAVHTVRQQRTPAAIETELGVALAAVDPLAIYSDDPSVIAKDRELRGRAAALLAELEAQQPAYRPSPAKSGVLGLVCAVALAVGAAFPAQSVAGVSTVGVNLVSAHSEKGYNNTNPGLYAVTSSGVAFGVYRNSVDKTSVWAGYRLESQPLGPVRAALLIGGVTGYSNRRPITPMVSPSVSVTLKAYTVRLSYLPRDPTKENSSDAAHLSVEMSFGGAK